MMPNVRKLMARLNPRGAGSGTGEHRPEDIVHALAYVRDPLAREVFCALWWPDGSRLVTVGLDALIATAQLSEWRSRADDMLNAYLVQAEASLRGQIGAAAVLRAAQSVWPVPTDPVYAQVRREVLQELGDCRLCEHCGGRGMIQEMARFITCQRCGGSGHKPRSKSERARKLGMSRERYRLSRRRDIYEWTYALCADGEATAAREMAEALG